MLTDVTERRCSRKRTGSSGVKPTRGRPPSLTPCPGQGKLFCTILFALKYNSEPSHVPRHSNATIMILSWPRTGGSAAHFPPVPSRVRPRIRPAAHSSSRHAPRACSVRQHDCLSPAPPRHSGRHGGDGLVTLPPPWRRPRHVTSSVATSRYLLLTLPITLPPPPQAHEFPARPAGSARQRFARIHRDSASLRHCAAVQHRSCSCPCVALPPHACIPCPAPISRSPIRGYPRAAARPAAVECQRAGSVRAGLKR